MSSPQDAAALMAAQAQAEAAINEVKALNGAGTLQQITAIFKTLSASPVLPDAALTVTFSGPLNDGSSVIDAATDIAGSSGFNILNQTSAALFLQDGDV
jgi:hypothetical protein